MNVTMYRYTGEIKKLHKSLPNDDYVLNFTNVFLKDGSSVTHPVLLIKAANLKDYNYCYIQEFSRYYFVEIDSISNGLWELKCSVDVLNTNWSEIEDNYAYIERSESGGNPLLEDDAVSFENKDTITLTDLSGETQGSEKNFDFYTCESDESTYDKNNIVINVINDKGIQPIAQTTFRTNPPIDNFSKTDLGAVRDNVYNYRYLLPYDKLNTIKTIYQQTESGFIKNLLIFPFEIKAEKNLQNVDITEQLRLGSTDFGGTNDMKIVSSVHYEFLNIIDYTFPILSDFNNYEPYTKYELWVPYIGWRGISASNISGKRIIISYLIDFSTGKANCYVMNKTDNLIIEEYETQIAISVGLSRSNMEQLESQALLNNITTALGVVSGALITAIGGATFNPLTIAGGVAGITSSVINGIKGNIGLHESGSANISSANLGVYNPRKVYMRITSKNKITSPSSQMGMPVKKVDLISNCSGFTQAKINKLSGLEYASKWEYDEIIRLFSEGVII